MRLLPKYEDVKIAAAPRLPKSQWTQDLKKTLSKQPKPEMPGNVGASITPAKPKLYDLGGNQLKTAQQMPGADPAVIGALTPFPGAAPLYAAGMAPTGQAVYDATDTMGDTLSGALKGLGFGAALGLTAGLISGRGALATAGLSALGAGAGAPWGAIYGAYSGAKERDQQRRQAMMPPLAQLQGDLDAPA